MDEERSESGNFRVVDKRRFNESGEARPADSTEAARKEEQKEPSKQAAPGAAKQPDPASQSRPSVPKDEQSGVDFSSFVVSLATQALVMMGEVPHPESGRAEVNLDAARQTIDIVAMLEEKTEGNLTEDEKNLVSEILASLQLAFVKKFNEQKKRKV